MGHEGGDGAARFGPYAVVRKIASGGMAEVYLCRLDSGHGFSKQLAVKAIHTDLSGDAAFRDMFSREARLASSLSHPNVVSVFDFGQEGSRCYLVMEYIDGCALSGIVSRMRDAGVRIPLPVWRLWMESALSGLGYLHARGIIHRDVSPGNILVTRSGAVKVTDFGISRKTGPIPEGKASVDGKVAYLSPEALEGSGADPRSDLYSAALIGAEMLLGRPVFGPTTLDDARGARSGFDPEALFVRRDGGGAEVAGIIAKALAFRPEDRFQDADALCMAIESAIPFRATRTESEAFWNALFPERAGEVTELDIESGGTSPFPGRRAAVVRESRPPYGAGVRGAAIGVAAALSIAIGGSYLYLQPDTASPVGEAETGRAAPAGEGVVSPDGRPIPEPADQPAPRHGTSATRSAPVDPGNPQGMQAATIDRHAPAGESPHASAEPAGGGNPAVSPPAPTGVIPVIQAIPWARVYEGERYLGDTPLRDVGLTLGEHRLRFVNEPLGADRVVSVTVSETGNPKLIVTLVGSRAPD